MERIDRVLNHPRFREELSALNTLEADRIFCGHDLTHLLDVARLMWIFNLEEEQGFSKEIIYAAALLHDIGRAEQYRSGVHHAEAGVVLGAEILQDAGFAEKESEMILNAIRGHSGSGSHVSALGVLLYRADKKSRSCYACPAADACNWPQDKKNLSLEY